MASFFVDANTIISALLFGGNEKRLLEYARLGLCELVTNEYVRHEVRRFLERAPGMGPAKRGRAMSSLSQRVLILPDPDPADLRDARPRVPDPRDVAVVVGFEQSGCEFLISGDRRLRLAVRGALTTRQALRRIEAELKPGGSNPRPG